MFKDAQIIDPTPKKKGKKGDEPVSIKGLRQYAEVVALFKTLEGVKKTLEEDIKGQGFDVFFERIDGRSKPENFKGAEAGASASFEFRKRTTRSELSQDEIDLLKKFNVTVGEEELSRQMYGINPKYAGNNDLLGAVEAALKDIVPADFIVLQPRKVKYIVDDATVDSAFKLVDVPREVVEAVTTLAVKSKLDDTNIKTIIEQVKVLLGVDEEKPTT